MDKIKLTNHIKDIDLKNKMPDLIIKDISMNINDIIIFIICFLCF